MASSARQVQALVAERPARRRVAGDLVNCTRRRCTEATTTLGVPAPAHGQADRPLELVKRFKAVLKRDDVTEVRFNDLRHTFGTRMAASNCQMLWIWR